MMSESSTFTAPNGRVITIRPRDEETRKLLSKKSREAILTKKRDMIARMSSRSNKARK